MKMKVWWRRCRHCCFWWRHTFGMDLPFPKLYNINSVIFFNFLKKRILSLPTIEISLILGGYDWRQQERAVVYWRVCVLSGKIDWWMSHGGVARLGGLGDESLLHVDVWRQSFGKPCNLLTDVNHLVKVNLAVWQVCRFPHYRLSMYTEGWK